LKLLTFRHVSAECDRDPGLADALWFDWEALVGLGFVACQQFS